MGEGTFLIGEAAARAGVSADTHSADGLPQALHEARVALSAITATTGPAVLFDDIPEGLRASRLDLPGPEPELELAARLQGLAARNRTDLASFLGAGVYRHWTPPNVDQLLLRGEWYTAYTPY